MDGRAAIAARSGQVADTRGPIFTVIARRVTVHGAEKNHPNPKRKF
jgi:hypothetical protein